MLIVRRLWAAACLIVVVVPAHADELPHEFVGKWCQTGTIDDGTTGVVVYHHRRSCKKTTINIQSNKFTIANPKSEPTECILPSNIERGAKIGWFIDVWCGNPNITHHEVFETHFFMYPTIDNGLGVKLVQSRIEK